MYVRMRLFAVGLLAIFLRSTFVQAQAGFDDDRVMLQGFYWESYLHGDPQHPEFVNKKWYDIVRDCAEQIRDGRFDLIWLPPPSYAGPRSAGYDPRQYWRLESSYGDFAQHRGLLEVLLSQGIEPVADIVINHRNGSQHWADFKNPDWDTKAICKNDEAFTNPDSEVFHTPLAQRGADEEQPSYAPSGATTYPYGDFRDLDHTNKQVQRDLLKYLLQLKSAGYRGWRYDMVHGYHARHIAHYNKYSQPTFSVGEYDWGRHAEQRGWIYHSAVDNLAGANPLKSSNCVFDFTTMFSLKDNKGNYRAWYGLGSGGLGMVGDSTDDLPWKQRAVTFLENHDTGYRTNEDGTPQKDHSSDSFQNNWEVEQAYAFILTHPGVPTVYWKHYFDWGDNLRQRIRALLNARKVAGVHAGSPIYLQNNARNRGVYAARLDGKSGELYLRVGGSDDDWQPTHSGYTDFREYARGAGWKVWLKLPGNPPFQEAPRRPAFDLPAYRPALEIDVPDSWLID